MHDAGNDILTFSWLTVLIPMSVHPICLSPCDPCDEKSRPVRLADLKNAIVHHTRQRVRVPQGGWGLLAVKQGPFKLVRSVFFWDRPLK